VKRKAERSDAKVAEKTDGNGCPVPRAKPGGYKGNRKSTAKSVFSLMTSFTERYQDILYTRRGE
jgi:hypothetical protein